MRSLLLLAFLVASPVILVAAHAEEPPTITIGVRIDAPPFAWHDAENDSYLGFLVDLCVDAVARAGFPAILEPITPQDRQEFFLGQMPEIDLLCDPTTISLARMRDFAALPVELGLEFTQIVFVANGAYLEHRGANDWDPAWTEGTLDRSGCAAPELRPESGAQETDAPQGGAQEGEAALLGAGFVRGTTGAEVLAESLRTKAIARHEKNAICPVEFATHRDAGRAFCDGHLRYYFGDQDILRSVVDAYRAGPLGCAFDGKIAPRPLSYEPYAFVVTARTPGFRQAFSRALYEVFHHETATARFHGNFRGHAMSSFLETLFRLNKIPAGISLQSENDAPRSARVASGHDALGPAD